jgi:hypothetical protein
MGPCVHYICEMMNELADIAVFPAHLLDSGQMAPNGIKNDARRKTWELPLE